MRRSPARDRLLAAGAELLLQGGLAGTGIQAVLARAGVPRGSFYHHFRSKEGFVLAVLDHHLAIQAAALESAFDQGREDPVEDLRGYFRQLAEAASGSEWRRGCLLGTLAQEAPTAGDLVRSATTAGLASWRSRIAEALTSAQEAGRVAPTRQPAELAGFIVDAWEGALLHAKAARSREPLDRFDRIVFDVVLMPAPDEEEP